MSSPGNAIKPVFSILADAVVRDVDGFSFAVYDSSRDQSTLHRFQLGSDAVTRLPEVTMGGRIAHVSFDHNVVRVLTRSSSPIGEGEFARALVFESRNGTLTPIGESPTFSTNQRSKARATGDLLFFERVDAADNDVSQTAHELVDVSDSSNPQVLRLEVPGVNTNVVKLGENLYLATTRLAVNDEAWEYRTHLVRRDSDGTGNIVSEQTVLVTDGYTSMDFQTGFQFDRELEVSESYDARTNIATIPMAISPRAELREGVTPDLVY